MKPWGRMSFKNQGRPSCRWPRPSASSAQTAPPSSGTSRAKGEARPCASIRIAGISRPMPASVRGST